jgi:hypothetical protein
MMMLCRKQIHLTVLSALLKFVSIALFNNHHFSLRIPKVPSTNLLSCDNLQLKTCSLHGISFLYVFRGYKLSPRMMKGISVPLPSKLAGYSMVDSKSPKK